MSTFTDCIGCLEEVDLLTILKLIIVVDGDGSYYLNTKFNEKEQCDDYSPAASCASFDSVEELIKRLIVEDDCGNCALNFIANVCDVCS